MEDVKEGVAPVQVDSQTCVRSPTFLGVEKRRESEGREGRVESEGLVVWRGHGEAPRGLLLPSPLSFSLPRAASPRTPSQV